MPLHHLMQLYLLINLPLKIVDLTRKCLSFRLIE